MPINLFLDITGPDGGRLYVLDEEGRLLRTSDFSIEGEPGLLLDEPISDNVEASSVSVPLDWLDFRLLDLDISDADNAREILPFELEGLLMEPPASYVLDAMICRPSQAEDSAQSAAGRVLAVYMSRERMASLMEMLKRAGLDPRAVTSLDLASEAANLANGDTSGLVDSQRMLEESERVSLARAELSSPSVNMRRGEFVFKGDVRKGLKSLTLTASLFVALMLVLTVVFSLRAVHAGKSADVLEERVLGVYGEIFPGKKPESARGLSYKVRSRLKELRGKSDSMRSVEALDMLMSLQEALPEGGGVKLLDVTLGLEGVILKGEGKDLDSIEKTRASMESFLSDVKITETGQAVSGQTGFTITARMDISGGGDEI